MHLVPMVSPESGQYLNHQPQCGGKHNLSQKAISSFQDDPFAAGWASGWRLNNFFVHIQCNPVQRTQKGLAKYTVTVTAKDPKGSNFKFSPQSHHPVVALHIIHLLALSYMKRGCPSGSEMRIEEVFPLAQYRG